MLRIVFVCVENSCRSQMAEGFARFYGKGKVEAFSAGSRPSGRVNETAVLVMKEVGIDISSKESKGFDSLLHKEFDMVVTMGCGDECPFVPAKKRIDWKIRDPKGRPIEFFREVREEIKEKVLDLMGFNYRLGYKLSSQNSPS